MTYSRGGVAEIKPQVILTFSMFLKPLTNEESRSTATQNLKRKLVFSLEFNRSVMITY